MSDIMKINNVPAKVIYDADIEMFRGEFIGLSGGADFYADTVEQLKIEGAKSLKIYLGLCKEKNIEPYKHYSGKFNLRVNPELHEQISVKANAENKSINSWVVDKLVTELAVHN